MIKRGQIPSLPNLNGNPLMAMDIETTGRESGYHEIIQIAILPLDLNLEICNDITPFYWNIAPTYPERADPSSMRIHKIKMDELVNNAPSQERVIDYLVDWASALPMAHGKRITPLCTNWAFERSYLLPWLGPNLFDAIFHSHARDTMEMGIMLNDRAAFMGMQVPFPYVGLKAMCKQFGITNENAHDALSDCIATAQLYLALMKAVIR